MIKFKKVTAIVLSAVMAVSMIGCGKDDEDEGKKKTKSGVEAKSIETIGDAYDAITSYTTGTFTVEAKVSADLEDESYKMTFSSDGKVDGDDKALDTFKMGVDGPGLKTDLEFKDLMVVTDGRAYINLDSIIKPLSDVDTEFGSYGLLLPEIDGKQDYVNKVMKLSRGAFDALLEGAEVEGEKGEFTATIKDPEDYKKAAAAILKWADDNKSDIESLLKDSTKLIDAKDYLNKLIDDIDDDLISAADVFGMGDNINEETINQIKEEANNSFEEATEELDDIDTSELFDGLADAREELEGMSDEEWTQAFEMFDKSEIVLGLKADSDAYTMTVDGEFSDDEHKIEFELTYKFTAEDVSIKVPSKTSTLTDIAKYASENQDVLMEVAQGFENWASQFESLTDDIEDTIDLDDLLGDGDDDVEIEPPVERNTTDPTDPTQPEVTEAPLDPNATEAPLDPSVTDAPATALQDSGDIVIKSSYGTSEFKFKYDTKLFNLNADYSGDGYYYFNTADDKFGSFSLAVVEGSDIKTLATALSTYTSGKIAGYDALYSVGDGYGTYYVDAASIGGIAVIYTYLNESKLTDEDIIKAVVTGLSK